MTTNKSKPPALSRIRDNQRHSRARRREYIEDLEKRLRNAELHNAQATIEMQAVARSIAKENSLLRSLLRKSGMTDIAITDYLCANHDKAEMASYITNPAANTPLQLPTRCKIPVSSQESHMQPLNQSSEHLIKAVVPTGLEKHPHPASTATTEPGIQSHYHNLVGLPHLLFEMAPPINEFTRINLNHKEPPGVAYKELNRNNATSCETAARIIVSMRGYSDIEET